MSLEQQFGEAQDQVQKLANRPDNATLLELYALFKQGSQGDASGKRPGLTDFKGRAKYDAWAGKKGMSKDKAMQAYVDLVGRLAKG